MSLCKIRAAATWLGSNSYFYPALAHRAGFEAAPSRLALLQFESPDRPLVFKELPRPAHWARRLRGTQVPSPLEAIVSEEPAPGQGRASQSSVSRVVGAFPEATRFRFLVYRFKMSGRTVRLVNTRFGLALAQEFSEDLWKPFLSQNGNLSKRFRS